MENPMEEISMIQDQLGELEDEKEKIEAERAALKARVEKLEKAVKVAAREILVTTTSAGNKKIAENLKAALAEKEPE